MSSDTYPAAYGYLEDTRSMDGGGIDVWLGPGGIGPVQAILCTVDLHKRDSEIKVLMDCSDEEMERIAAFQSCGLMRAILVRR